MTTATGKAQSPGGGALGWIGIDESGKGDYFGPLVIAAVHVTPRVAEDLEALNVRDSKKISDGMIKKLAVDIRVLCKHRDRKSTRLNSSHLVISYAVFCLKK